MSFLLDLLFVAAIVAVFIAAFTGAPAFAALSALTGLPSALVAAFAVMGVVVARAAVTFSQA